MVNIEFLMMCLHYCDLILKVVDTMLREEKGVTKK